MVSSPDVAHLMRLFNADIIPGSNMVLRERYEAVSENISAKQDLVTTLFHGVALPSDMSQTVSAVGPYPQKGRIGLEYSEIMRTWAQSPWTIW